MLSVAIDDGVATVTMNDGGTNALTHAMVIGLHETFARLSANRDIRAIVLTGEGEYFSSGAAREVIDDLISGRRASSELLLPRVVLDCDVPVIAAMAGHAVGGGFALGVACDLVVAASESRYALTFMSLGFTPGMGTTRLLEHVLSPAVAHELLYTSEARRGRDLAFNHVVPRAEVLSRARDLAARIATNERPQIVALKRTLAAPRRAAFEVARAHEASMHELSFSHRRTES